MRKMSFTELHTRELIWIPAIQLRHAWNSLMNCKVDDLVGILVFWNACNNVVSRSPSRKEVDIENLSFPSPEWWLWGDSIYTCFAVFWAPGIVAVMDASLLAVVSLPFLFLLLAFCAPSSVSWMNVRKNPKRWWNNLQRSWRVRSAWMGPISSHQDLWQIASCYIFHGFCPERIRACAWFGLVMWQPPCPITSARAGGHRGSTCDSQDDNVWGIHRGSDSHPKQMLSKIGCQYVLCICWWHQIYLILSIQLYVHFSVTVSLCFPAKCPTHTKFHFQNCLSRWWFQAFSEFSPLLREMIEID